MDLLVLDFSDRTQKEASQRPNTKRLRRTKLVGALSVAAFIGVGSYLATYRTLVIISTPAAIAPIPVDSAVSVAAPVPVPAAT